MTDQDMDNRRLVAQADKALADLEADISLAATFAAAAADKAGVFAEQVRSSYADATKRIILGDEKGSTDLQTLVGSISEHRVTLLSTAIASLMARATAALTSPFSNEDYGSLLAALDEVQKGVANQRSTLASNFELAQALRTSLGNAVDVTRRLETVTRRTKHKAPFQVLIWGTPVLVGLIASGQFTWW